MYYAALKKHDIANGTGIRVSLFVSGCTHHCKNCFNQETWDFHYGRMYTEETEREILEALKPEFKTYQEQVVKNARALAEAMTEEGFNLVSGGTDNHLMLVDLQNMGITGKELQNRLDEVYITVNKNAVPNDPASPFVTSGIRIGTPAVTTRGLKEEDMKTIARLIKLTVTDYEAKADEIRSEVNQICARYPIYA